MDEGGTPFEQASPTPSIAALLWRRDPRSHEPTHDDLSRLAFIGTGLDQEIDHGGASGEQGVARRPPLAAIGDALPLRLRHELAEVGLEIDKRLQVFLRNPLLGELGDHSVSAAPMRSMVGESVSMAAILGRVFS